MNMTKIMWTWLTLRQRQTLFIDLDQKISIWVDRLLLVKCYDNKMVKLPFSLIILSEIKPQVANQQKNDTKPLVPYLAIRLSSQG